MSRAKWKRKTMGSKYLSIFIVVVMILSGCLGLSNTIVYAENGGLQNQVVNGSFEEMIEDSWVAKGWDMTNTVWITNADAFEGSFSQALGQWNCNTVLSQTLTVEAGLYNVSLYVWANGALEGSSLNVNGQSTAIQSGGAVQIDGTKSWDKIELKKVRVENDGILDLQIVIGDVLEGIDGFLDKVSIERTSDLPLYPEEASDRILVNGGFTNDYSGWTVSGSDMVLVDAWSPNGNDDTKLSVYSANPVDVEVYQNVKNLPAGNYTIQAIVYTAGSHSGAVLYADAYDGKMPAAVEMPQNSGEWVPISVNVDVEDGYLKVGFHVTGPGGMWLAVDDVTITYNDPYTGDTYIQDNGFENDNPAWVLQGTRISHGHNNSDYALLHEGGEALDSYQEITNIENGYYTLTAWSQNSGGQDTCYLYAGEMGSSRAMTAIPRNNFPYDNPDTWKKVTVRGIHVTNGKITVGLYTEGGDTSACLIDNFKLEKDNAPYELLIGGDITELTYVEDKGGKYYDFSGEERDPLEILAENGWNIVRIRIYNNPGKGRGDGTYYVPEGYQDVEDGLRLAKRAKAAGLQIQLSFHYSDYWTNPGTQIIPASWQSLIEGKTDEEATSILNTQIYDFTKEVLEKMNQQGTTPEYVSIGNETRGGMLFPYGSVARWDTLAGFYNTGARAIRETAPDSKIIIHLDDGGNTSTYQTYFRNAEQRGVDYDIIGTSYYPFWTNKSALQFTAFVNTIAKEFGKPVMCMETGFNWTANTGAGRVGQLNHNGPYGGAGSSTPQLQRDFMIELFNEIQGVENGMCIGDLYWDPIMLYAGEQTGWAYFETDDKNDVNVVDNTALFDFDGKALPVLSVYSHNTRGSSTGMMSGKILDADGKPITGAQVTAGTAQVTTNYLGDYFFPALDPGNYTISVDKAGLGYAAADNLDVIAGEVTKNAPVTIQASQDLYTLSGTVDTVRKETGITAVQNVVVRLVGTSYDRAVLTDASGSFLLENIPADTYELRISCNGYAEVRDRINIADNTNSNYTIADNFGSLSGYAYDGQGQPVSGATVYVGSKYVITGNDGSFIMEEVPIGSNYTVTASRNGYMNGHAEGITILFGQETSGVTIYLPKLVDTLINGGFESNLDGWTIIASPGNAIYTQTGSGGGQDSAAKLSAWADTAYEAEVYQSLEITETGTYLLRCYSQNSGSQDEMYVYVKDSKGNILGKSELSITVNWTKIDIAFQVSAAEVITVGIYTNSTSPGTWCNFDNFALGLISADTDPGTTDPGTTDPGTTNPETTDPGTANPGTTDPGTTSPGTTDPGITDPGTTDPGTTNPGTTDPGKTKPGSSGNTSSSGTADDNYYGTGPEAQKYWNEINAYLRDIISSRNSITRNIVTGRNIIVPAMIVDTLKRGNDTLAMHTGTGITFSISSTDIPMNAAGKNINLSIRSGEGVIPTDLIKEKLSGTISSRQISMASRDNFGITVNMHVALGVENADKYANLYYYNERTGKLDYLGSFQINASGQAMFGITGGADFILTISNQKPNEKLVSMSFGATVYIVKKGDTLSNIAARNGVSVAQLRALNMDIRDIGKIYPGQVIFIK